MSMQLRWMVQGHKPPVLQWRFYNGEVYRDHRRGADEGWTEWADVPVVNACPTCGSVGPHKHA